MLKVIPNFLEYLSQQNKSFWVLFGILLALLVGIIDYTVVDFFVFELYLIPVLAVAWFAGRRAGIFIAFVSATSGIAFDMLETPVHLNPWVHCWNFCFNFGFFMAAVYLLAFLQRTLTSLHAVAERERNINKQLGQEIEQRKRLEEELKKTQEKVRTLTCSDLLK